MATNLNPALQKLYFIKDAERLIGRNRLTLRRWWKKKIFPEPILISNRLAWHAETVNEWINNHIQGA